MKRLADSGKPFTTLITFFGPLTFPIMWLRYQMKRPFMGNRKIVKKVQTIENNAISPLLACHDLTGTH